VFAHAIVEDRRTSKLLESDESVAIQYLQTVTYKDALRCHSQFGAGPGQAVFGRSGRKRVDGLFLQAPGVWRIVQVHEAGHLSQRGHETWCRFFRGVGHVYNSDTRISDEENLGYARHLSSALPEISIEYETISECVFKHGNPLKCGRGTDARMVLKKWHKDDCVFKPDWLVGRDLIPAKELVERLESPQSEQETAASFVVIRAGARETADDIVSKITGFCLQRSTPTPDELGEAALDVVRASLEEAGASGCPRAYLQSRCENGPFTMLRKSFHRDICLSVSNLRWLQKYRGLENVEIVHYIHYECRDYLTEFIVGLLQDRHDLIRAGKKASLDATILKIEANAIFGSTLMERSRYPRFTIAAEHWLHKQRVENIDNLTVVGATEHKGRPSLLYLVQRSQKGCRIRNLIQQGALILANSRNVFFHQLFCLLELFDPRKVQLTYADTDSLFLFCDDLELRNCVLPERLEEFDNLAPHIFEDPGAAKTQCGLHKVETTAHAGLFRCIKSYSLLAFEGESNVVKCRGMCSRIRKAMPQSSFLVPRPCEESEGEPLPRKRRRLYFQNLGMQPSQAGEVLITLKRRTMTSALNTKRRLCAVSRRQSVGYGLPQKRPNPSLFRISQTRTHSSNVFDDGSDAQVGP